MRLSMTTNATSRATPSDERGEGGRAASRRRRRAAWVRP